MSIVLSSRRPFANLAGQLFVLLAVDHRHGGVLGAQRLVRGGGLVPECLGGFDDELGLFKMGFVHPDRGDSLANADYRSYK